MAKVKILNRQTITEVMEMERVLLAVQEAYIAKTQKEGVLWPLIFHEYAPETAEVDLKSGTLNNANIYGLKVVSWFEDNIEKNLNPLVGTILIFDKETGYPIGLLDAGYLTGLRTGAAGALGAKALAREDSENLLIVGAGGQCVFQVAATVTVMKNIKNVYIYDGLNAENAKQVATGMKERLKNEFGIDKDITYNDIGNIEEAVKKSDIIITITPSREPIIKAEWIKPGTHLSCIGSDTSGKQEVDEKIMEKARIFVDDIKQASDVGEIETALKKGIISSNDIAGEIGDIFSGEKKGRFNAEEITVFDSTGIALQDLSVAKVAIDLANEKQLGVVVEL